MRNIFFMRNSKWFRLNLFDEEVDVADLGDKPLLNLQATQSLDISQEYLINSSFFKKLNVAYEKWQQIMNQNNDALLQMFKNRREREFTEINLDPFRHGKYWQMLEYLDGPHPIQSQETSWSREDYQNDLFMNENTNLLQIGWDLAVNSALLCDFMPQKSASGDKGSVHLLEHLVWDIDSMFYPSVTGEFQKRVINESFWQCLCDLNRKNEYKVLDRILTGSFQELDQNYAKDNILRWNGPHRKTPLKLTNNALVVGYSGPESFEGISPRAVENYGKFLNQVSGLFTYQDKPSLLPFMKMYVEAVNCGDWDGNDYFMDEGEKDRLLSFNFIRDNPELQTSEVCES